MRNPTIARNYAEALLALARKADAMDAWGALVGGLADAMQSDDRLTNFLAAPQIAAAEKNRVLAKAFSGALPRPLLRFLQKLVDNRRQLLLPDIATEYGNLVDEQTGRVHAQVTVAREVSAADRASIASRLSDRLGKTVVPHIHVNPAVLGGVLVRVGDTVMDGTVRKRLATLRSRLVSSR